MRHIWQRLRGTPSDGGNGRAGGESGGGQTLLVSFMKKARTDCSACFFWLLLSEVFLSNRSNQNNQSIPNIPRNQSYRSTPRIQNTPTSLRSLKFRALDQLQ